MSANLSTELLVGGGTSENLANKVFNMLRKFNLQSKNLIAVTDSAATMIKCCKIMKVTRLTCLAHGLHNLLYSDIINKRNKGPKQNKTLSPPTELLSRMREAHRSLMYRYAEMQDKFDAARDKKIMDLINTHENIGLLTRFNSYNSKDDNNSLNDNLR